MPRYTTIQRDVSKITPYDRNPRKNDKAVDAVAASIQEFGFQQPIVVDSEGIIIVGHTRYKAAIQLGLKTVPVHVADGLTSQQAKAYRLADNKTVEIAEWDFDLLVTELTELDVAEFDMSVYGFVDIDIDLESNSEAPDDAPSVPLTICPKCGFEFPHE